jgi:hypothetical protein
MFLFVIICIVGGIILGAAGGYVYGHETGKREKQEHLQQQLESAHREVIRLHDALGFERQLNGGKHVRVS